MASDRLTSRRVAATERNGPRVGVLAVGVAAVALLAHCRALGHGFLAWDDGLHVVDNPYLGLGAAQFRWMVTTTHMGHYHPLTWLSYSVDRVLWGLNPAGFHATNLALHALNAALLFLIARELFLRAPPRPEFSPSAANACAAFAAAIWAAHPLRVESVAWVSERRDVLSGLFFFASIFAHLSYAAATDLRSGAAWRWRAALHAFFAAALLSKAVTVTLPLLLVLIDVYPLGRFPGAIPVRLLRSLREKAALFVMAAVAGAGAILASRSIPSTVPWELLPLAPRLVIAGYAAAFYAFKTGFPAGLSPLYELPVGFAVYDALRLSGVAAVAAVSVAAWAGRRRSPALAATWGAYLLLLFPMSGFFQNGPQIAADRYSYLPGAALALGLGAALSRFGLSATLGRGLAAGWVAVLVAASVRQGGFWRDNESLWRRALDVAPATVTARANLAVELRRKGREAEAEEHLRAALALQPRHIGAHLTLGLARRARGDVAGARAIFSRAWTLDPSEPLIPLNLALLDAGAGEWASAETWLREALALDPGLARAHEELGALLLRSGRRPEAERHLREAVRLRPDQALYAENLGKALLQQGRAAEAEAFFRTALELEPRRASALRLLEAARAGR